MTMAAENPNASRVQTEYELLEAMYPDDVSYNSHTREVHFSQSGASLHIRLPDDYPQSQIPEILSASNASKIDLRDRLKESIKDVPFGEEALDSIVATFQTILTEETISSQNLNSTTKAHTSAEPPSLTIIIWLHHLLATSKRKMALSPPLSGLSKPGYPGVLIYSGPRYSVHEHVNVLKQENWAAFQIRYEEAVEWKFEHGEGVLEVETMGEVVKEIGEGRQKQWFLEAMRMKG